MSAQPTPGPWIRQYFNTVQDELVSRSVPGATRVVCTVHVRKLAQDRTHWGETEPDPVGQANARLIAAAPAVTAALQTLHKVCAAMDLENQGERPTEEEYQAAMAGAAEALAMAGAAS